MALKQEEIVRLLLEHSLQRLHALARHHKSIVGPPAPDVFG
jgi:hypothetical protein